ncbi:hypothetical protein PFICI_09261 [Pestalotiopsis fici W106-1]|uniref:Zinc finger PHD-type domain-containing protein n=1 Tax=Pestalotiopsis fici (strain W106-1 / CGMCC3.15140) TaxID=1229662 RepID=W3WZU9_PESFW|nr:uncharacterized protein PFICI_09261 [Pestalotiopsis fici W106-1]ETS79408.1 hypothetical protein PFICI_09261 [Pestalotiopsis fici W106-1]
MTTPLPYKHGSPFLHRVWRSAVDMLAAAQKSTPDDDRPRAAKRRRITEDSTDPGIFASVGPLFSDPSQGYSRTLRFQVLKVGHVSDPDPGVNGLLHGNGSPVKKNASIRVVQARCRLTISSGTSSAPSRPIYCDSQPCEIRVSCDRDGFSSHGRVHLQQPFVVGAEKLYVMRDDSPHFMLADSYLITTELESVGDPNWPPFDLLPKSSWPRSQQWALSSTHSYAYSKPRLSTPVVLRKTHGVEEIRTDLVMETDLRWSAMNSEQPSPQIGDILAPLKTEHVNGRTDNSVNKNDHDDDDDAAADDEDGDEEAITPSRSLRMRDKQQVYNLKLLSDKARGREMKERKKRKDAKVKGMNDAKPGISGRVTWTLPDGKRAMLDHWHCIYCYVPHDNIDQLQRHMVQHSEWKIATDFSQKDGWHIVISEGEQLTPRAARRAAAQARKLESPTNISPPVSLRSRRSAPSHSTEAITSAKQQLVPNTIQPMYDRLSKAVLEPLSKVDEPPIDNAWLLQKHRDTIMEYTDVDPDEKEYIVEWDAFLFTRKGTVVPYLKNIYLEFIQEKASWLLASQARMHEALKHLAYLNGRDLLDKSTASEAVEILRSTKPEVQDKLPPAQIPRTALPAYSSKAGCGICGQIVPATSNQLICANLDCETPFYHDHCMDYHAKQEVSDPNWHCNKCC